MYRDTSSVDCAPLIGLLSGINIITFLNLIIIIFIYSPISNVHKGTSSVDYITKCIYINQQ